MTAKPVSQSIGSPINRHDDETTGKMWETRDLQLFLLNQSRNAAVTSISFLRTNKGQNCHFRTKSLFAHQKSWDNFLVTYLSVTIDTRLIWSPLTLATNLFVGGILFLLCSLWLSLVTTVNSPWFLNVAIRRKNNWTTGIEKLNFLHNWIDFVFM